MSRIIMTQEAVYEFLYNKYYEEGLLMAFTIDERMKLSRRSNIYAVQHTQKVWKNQFDKEKIVETIFRGDQIIYILAASEGVYDFNSVDFYDNGILIDMKNVKLVFQTVDQED